jgi:Na+/proline symporter
MVANRSIGTGLTASAVISSWLYSTALLGASTLTYSYGLALGVWWGASASTMVCLMAYLSIEAKRKVPNAHTMLEIIRVRYGTAAHILWIFLTLLNNSMVFSSMILGAAAAITSLTGMNPYASTYLLPLGVAVYTYFGGLRATFLTDYVHTFIVMIILVWFTIKVGVPPSILLTPAYLL